ncbi:MAG: PD-(D/E)XK nuclease family protein [Candidatus Daviesbacteria bacterium]|nr:PD-(D/E)XK nuclease family protein [Candidatus Daviesbacteria bacterium]
MISKPQFKYIKNPIYISYTSLRDFLKCPRSYYLKNIYKNKDDRRIQVASPYLSLGSTVHDSVKWFLETAEKPALDELIRKYRDLWPKFSGKRGGFSSREEEGNFGKRGLKMLENFYRNWQVLGKKAPEITFPKYNLLDNIVLIGNFDYIGERKDGSLHVVDFKTGANDEDDPTQLYIYSILAEVNFEKSVSAAGFWYLDREDQPRDIVLDPLEPKLDWLKEKAKELKKTIELGEWTCVKNDAPDVGSSPKNGALCRDCKDYQAIIDGKGEFQFTDYRYKKDVYYLNK